MPTDAVSKYFYYNKAFFAEHKLTPPTDFDGLLKLCKDIRAVDPSIVPWPLGNSERWKLNHVITMLNDRMLGPGTAADYALKAPDDQLFTNPGYVEAWQKVVDLKEAGCFQDAPNATSPEATRSMFASEVSPMIYCGTWCANIFFAEGFNDFAMFRFPAVDGGKGDPGASFLVPQGFMVSAKTQHPAEAVEWMNFLSRTRWRPNSPSHRRHSVQRQADRPSRHRAIQLDRQRRRRGLRLGDGARRAARGVGLQRLSRRRRRDPQRHQDAAAGHGVHPRRGARAKAKM